MVNICAIKGCKNEKYPGCGVSLFKAFLWGKMDYQNMLRLQKCLYFNYYTYLVWVPVTGFFLFTKVDALGHLTKYLSVTVFTLLLVIEAVRIYLGHYGNLSCRVPELAGFLMLTILMQMPLVSFFLFNPYLLNTPTELILHLLLWLLTVFEVVFGFMALKQASDMAKSIYLSHASVVKAS